jgi:hypothetical protein
VDTPEAARHAAHLVRLLGDDLEGSFAARPEPRAAFPVLDAVWQARGNARFAPAPDAE